MTDKVKSFKDIYFVSCPQGVEKLLVEELLALGITQIEESFGGVTFKESVDKAFKVILHSRIASRIFKKCYSLMIKDEQDLYIQTEKIEWQKVFDLNQTFKIKTIFSKAYSDKSSMFFSQKLKDAICDRFRKACDQKRPNVNKDHADISFLLHINHAPQNEKKEASIYIDMTGTQLSNRGYRSEKFPAPLRENLAAAIVLSTTWNKEDLFIDSMCGSGTLIIEAALIKGEIPPSFLKLKTRWDFQNHLYFKNNPQFQRTLKKELAIAEDMVDKGFKKLISQPDKLIGYDIAPASIRVTNRHLKNCKLQDIITIRRRDAVTLERPDVDSGIIICNVPYGERMGEIEELETLYHQYGENLKKNFKGFTAYIFTGNQQLRKKIALQTKKRIHFYNGKLDCRLVEYELF